MTEPLSPTQLETHIWKNVIANANFAGLDASKFDDEHQQIIQEIVRFLLTTKPKSILQEPTRPKRKSLSRRIARRAGILDGASLETAVIDPTIQPIPPIIICGRPGTGKTTFLYLLDNVIRHLMALPDNIVPQMQKGERIHPIHKRAYSGQQVSLLSVKKWTELLHFYAWDVEAHGLNELDLAGFVQDYLLPMRVLFADEVEMTGYSPTIPTLAKFGILVVGTSNQYQFKQLDNHDLPARIYRMEGEDMRLGDPADAVVRKRDEFWALFDALASNDLQTSEQVVYRTEKRDTHLFVLLDLETAVKAPMLETDWSHFFQTIFAQQMNTTFATDSGLTLLLDHFSLDLLKTDFNSVIRFVALFDAIEQLGLGVLVRNAENPPELSRESMTFLKTTIYNAIGVPDDVKRKTAVGLDRCTSRIGQAGHKAHMSIAQL